MPLSLYLAPIGVNPIILPEFDKISAAMAVEYGKCISALGSGFIAPYDSTATIMGVMSGSQLIQPQQQGYDTVVGLCKGFNSWIYLVAAGMMVKPNPVTPPVSTAGLLPAVISTTIQSALLSSYYGRNPSAPVVSLPTSSGLEQPFFTACGTYIYNIYVAP